jgi:hypothetical protein
MGKCWNCLLGHLGPGAYITTAGLLFFLHGLRASFLRRRRLEQALFAASAVFGPLGFLTETAFTWPPQMANLHHYSLYLLVMVAALLYHFCRIKQLYPRELSVAYECLMLPVAGFIFLSHNHGNALYVGFHQVMFPGLIVSGIMHYVCETQKNAAAMKVLRGLGISTLGTWFAHVGVGFFLYGDSGTLGSSMDEIDPHHAWASLGNILAGHVMSWAVLGLVMVAVLTYFGCVDFESQAKKGYKVVEMTEREPMIGEEVSRDIEDACE